MNGPWTDTACDVLRAKWAEGLSGTQIANEIGLLGIRITRNAVIGKIHRLGLSGTKPRAPAAPRASRITKPRTYKPRIKFNAYADIGQAPETTEAVDLPPEVPPEVPVDPVALQDLKPHHCRYPYGEPSHDMLHCGADVMIGNSYCARHCRIVYAPRRSHHGRPFRDGAPGGRSIIT